ncbi:PQQ-binding-like beta-propeller repeat protein [Streptomyces sp. SM12]|uniref:outer membrane protein assembly factor BamB family protein n=1 Tax=Streptomyces sp. SM12 TaxID=1071602 RepID=UPI000CD55DD0|nr:PQQ-binding-like beta-propeller repeat protein [Streptomyces sp. SM12]
MRGRGRRAPALALAAALLTAPACTAAPDRDERRLEFDTSRTIAPVWERRTDRDYFDGAWATPETLVLRAGDEIRGHDTATGEPRWTLKAPEGAGAVCTMSRTVNSAGIGVVLFDAPGRGGCALVAAVATATGEILWSDIPEAPDTEVSPRTTAAASIGEAAVTYTDPLGGLHRYAAHDGAVLPSPVDPGDGCTRFAVHDAVHTVLVRDSAPSPSPGSCAPDTGEAPRLDVHDSETGRHLWSRPAGVDGYVPHRLLASDPLVLESYQRDDQDIRVTAYPENGGRGVRLTDAGWYATPLGPPGRHTLGAAKWWTPLSASGVLVSGSMEPTAHDLRTGEELWRLPPFNGSPVAARGDSLVTSVFQGDHDVLVTHDLRDPSAAEALGVLDCSGCRTWAGVENPPAFSVHETLASNDEQFFVLVDGGAEHGLPVWLVSFPLPG